MTIDCPQVSQIPQLRRLWQEAFGDTDAFLDIFFHRAFSPPRCHCITVNEEVVSALYWFDCTWSGKHLAYIYAVATAGSHKGQGLCRALMEKTHAHLRRSGYDGSILSPQSKELFAMYGKFGYRTCSYVQEFTCDAGDEPIGLQQATVAEYAAARRSLLPANSVLQEDITLEFLSAFAQLYTGDNLVLAAYPNEEKLFVCELLGDPKAAPQILTGLGFPKGTFRTPGQQMPFAMYRSLTDDDTMPAYLGLSLN